MPVPQESPVDIDRLVGGNPRLRDRIERLLPFARLRTLPPGSHLFHAGDEDAMSHYLLSGQILLHRGPGSRPEPLRASDPEAGFPIAPGSPRRCHALAATSVSILSIETEHLERLLGSDETAGPARMSPATNLWGIGQRSRPIRRPGDENRLRELPTSLVDSLPTSLRSILGDRLVRQTVAAGTDIVTQGDPGETYYYIARGLCRVTRRRGRHGGRQAIVAVLQRGRSFGAEALIDGGEHRHTVTALQDTILLTLDRNEFMSLLVRPFLRWQSFDEAMESLKKDEGRLLDVRSTRVFQQGHIPRSINLPLALLPQAAQLLDPRHAYTICCESPRRGMIAAFLLAEQGIRSAILEGGVRRYFGRHIDID